jgi:hypothetical protein
MNKEKEVYLLMKKIPNFESEDEERKFWYKSDSTNYIDWSKAQKMVLPNLKPSTKKDLT